MITISDEKLDEISITTDGRIYGGSYIFEYEWRDVGAFENEDRKKFFSEVSKWEIEKKECACGRYLSRTYIYIIHTLKEAGLLDKDYKMMCCFCHILACVGFEIPKEWTYVRFVNYSDTLCNIDYSSISISAFHICTGKLIEVIVRIHDTEKALSTGRILNDIKMTKPKSIKRQIVSCDLDCCR